MHENIVAGLELDESEALAGVKPLYSSLFFQLCVSFLLTALRSYFEPGRVRGRSRLLSYLVPRLRGLQALGALGHFEFNRLAVVQRFVAISHDCGEMHENIFTALALDESKALAGVEPLHCSLFFTHCVTLFC